MTIDFHQAQNRYSYATRHADPGWAQAMQQRLAPGADLAAYLADKCVADVGCGGGIYSLAWRELGAQAVEGVDFSAQMVQTAAERAAGDAQLHFRQGEAGATGLESASVDIVFERALIHHLKDYGPCCAEALRVLKPGGVVILQDRTPEDVALPGAPTHLRGYFFECFPRLKQFEGGRRPPRAKVEEALREAGFTQVASNTLEEVRKRYAGFAELEADLAARTGRSILHELSDDELRDLIAFIKGKLPAGPIVEQDRWTMWTGVKPR
ncbi:MAG TPA: methyltransferase domain-containing protein [Burkholderiales bacterium]